MSSLHSTSCLKSLNLCKILALIYKILQDCALTNVSDLQCHSPRHIPLHSNYTVAFFWSLKHSTLKLFHNFGFARDVPYAYFFLYLIEHKLHEGKTLSTLLVIVFLSPSIMLYKVDSQLPWPCGATGACLTPKWTLNKYLIDEWMDEVEWIELIYLLPIPFEYRYF